MRPGFLGDVSDSLDPPFSAKQIALRQQLLERLRGKSKELFGQATNKLVSATLQQITDQEDIVQAQKLIVDSMQERISQLVTVQTIPPNVHTDKEIAKTQTKLNLEMAKLREQANKLVELHQKLYDYNRFINLL